MIHEDEKIGLVGIYFPGAYDALHENVPEGFELVDALSPEAYGNLADCEYLISRLDIDPDIINHTPNVKFWQRWGAGFDHVDLKAWGGAGFRLRPVRASIPALWRSWRSC